jgi:hypothetical protein
VARHLAAHGLSFKLDRFLPASVLLGKTLMWGVIRQPWPDLAGEKNVWWINSSTRWNLDCLKLTEYWRWPSLRGIFV